MSWHDEIPKVELHVHLEGAVPLPALFELIEKYGGDPSVPDAAALGERFRFRSFRQFIDAWEWKNSYLREYEDFSFIAERTARAMAGQNILYAEMFFSPSIFARRGLAVQDLTRAVRAGLSRVPGIDIALVADLVRDYGPASERATLAALGEVRELGVIGVGVGGSEDGFPPAPFAGVFEDARRLGFRTTAHAGEAAGPSGIRSAVRDLKVERIGHGTRAGEDPKLADELVRRRIPLEMCPGSNVRTGVVRRLAEHPVRGYFEAGMVVTVNSDDPSMFETSLAEEYRGLERECGFSREEIRGLVLAAVASSWLSEERKASLAAAVLRHPGWHGPAGSEA
jgi:adenosine deaminase